MAPPSARPQLSDAEVEPHLRAALLVMNDHYLRYLLQVYTAFDGDMVAALVLGEVAHHNVAAVRQGLSVQELSARLGDPSFRAALIPTNAFSIAQATGIPRETVRRKVAWLVARDYLRQDGRANLVVSPQAVSPFFGLSTAMLNDLLDTSAQLHDLFDRR